MAVCDILHQIQDACYETKALFNSVKMILVIRVLCETYQPDYINRWSYRLKKNVWFNIHPFYKLLSGNISNDRVHMQ